MLLKCKCGKTLQVQDALAGKRVKCPTCKGAGCIDCNYEGWVICPYCTHSKHPRKLRRIDLRRFNIR